MNMHLSTLKTVASIRSFSHMRSKSVGIIGVPFGKGQTKIGVEETPGILRKLGLVEILQQHMRVKDYGDIEIKDKHRKSNPIIKNLKNWEEFEECSVTLIRKVREVLKENDIYLTIGGDHSIGFGSIAGHLLANPNTSVIWIDAHADINLNTTSVSGNIHGMPVALLMEDMRKYWKNVKLQDMASIGLPAGELVYIGLRDIDCQEKLILNKLGIKMFPMDAVDKYGIAKILEMCLDTLNPKNKLHISFDIDALDANTAPSTGTPVLGGLTLREGLFLMESLYATNRIEGFDLVEINPRIGTQVQSDYTLSVGLEIIKSGFGYKRS